MRVMTQSERDKRMRDLVELVAEPVRRYLFRRTDAATADDVFGDTLLVCWRRIDDVPQDALPWAIVVARHCLNNAYRAKRRRTRLIGRIIALDPPSEAVDSDPPVSCVTGPTVDATVTAALAELRNGDAEVLRLWAWDELTSPQLAVVLGISANAAAIRLHRAKGRLRRILLKSHGPSGHVFHEEGHPDA